jgi:hypothetical protein
VRPRRRPSTASVADRPKARRLRRPQSADPTSAATSGIAALCHALLCSFLSQRSSRRASAEPSSLLPLDQGIQVVPTHLVPVRIEEEDWYQRHLKPLVSRGLTGTGVKNEVAHRYQSWSAATTRPDREKG